jgi:iduronate 2-sulfatase
MPFSKARTTRFHFLIATAAFLLFVGRMASAADKQPLNVLFIAVDDLRPELNCYGASHIKSPNIDELAQRGLQFNRAYCQFALCNPSRASLLTGRRPESIQVYDLVTFLRKHDPDVLTLPQMFMRNGYEARSIGKIFHVSNGNHQDDASWSIRAWRSPKDNAATKRPPAKEKIAKPKRPARPNAKPVDAHANDLPFESRDVADDELIDGQIAEEAIRELDELKDRPFFLAVGFHRPHMPWVAPAKYWQMYDRDSIQLAANPQPPQGAPKFANNNGSEFRRYKGVPKKGPIPEAMAREAIHGYYASVSYMDAQIGRVLDELDRLGLRDKTIVVLWGDHGYQLGDHGTWNKRTNWEAAARVPMIINVPGQQLRGQTTEALVELIDIYPTLAELTGLEPPANLDGRSIVPLLSDPTTPWKDAAFTLSVKDTPRLGKQTFGRSMRTDRYRFVEWTGPKSAEPVYELYDLESDPLEKVNIADKPENKQLRADLAKRLHSPAE